MIPAVQKNNRDEIVLKSYIYIYTNREIQAEINYAQ
jgi:hypothetical protein